MGTQAEEVLTQWEHKLKRYLRESLGYVDIEVEAVFAGVGGIAHARVDSRQEVDTVRTVLRGIILALPSLRGSGASPPQCPHWGCRIGNTQELVHRASYTSIYLLILLILVLLW